MRSLVLIALAGAIFGSLSVAARSDDAHDSVVGKSQTSLKRIVVPYQKMMRWDPGIVSLTPGAENRGSQLVDPARTLGGQNPGAAVRTQDQDTPAAAAERTTTNASRTGPSEAASTASAGTSDKEP